LLVLFRPKRRLRKENPSLIMKIKPIELNSTMKG
jgi:hypothetical protein